MRESGFTLVEAQVSLVLTLVLVLGIGGLFLSAAKILRSLANFQERTSPYLLASRIAEDYSKAVFYEGKYYYRATGIGLGHGGRCVKIYGRKTQLVFFNGKLAKNCPEGEMVLFLRKKRIFLRGTELFMEVNGSVQPLASGVKEFLLGRGEDFVKVKVEAAQAIRRLR